MRENRYQMANISLSGVAGYPVCVGIPALTAPSTTVPSPLEPGTDPSCTAYHLVVSGDTCFAIEPVYIITADQVSVLYKSKRYRLFSRTNRAVTQFNKWNPNVGTSCWGLQPGYYVCVWAPS
jgi:chitinase